MNIREIRYFCKSKLKTMWRHDIKILLYFGIIASLISIPAPILEFFQQSIINIVTQSISFPSEVGASSKIAWALNARKDSSQISYAVMYASIMSLSIIFMIFYRERYLNPIFILALSSYFIYFSVFTFVIFPQIETIFTLQENIYYEASYIYQIWRGLLFYIGGSSVFNVFIIYWNPLFFAFLFWMLANQTVTSKQASWIYPSLVFFHLLGKGIGSSIVMFLMESNVKTFPYNEYDPGLIIITILLAIMIPLIYLIFNRLNIKEDDTFSRLQKNNSLSTSFQIKYLVNIAIIVLCYGVYTTYLNDFSKFLQLGNLSTLNIEKYSTYISYYEILFEIVFILCTCILINKIGWFYSALLVPVVILLLGVFLVGQLYFPTHDFLFWNAVLTKGAISGTYWTLFLSTKEMAYIPLPLKTKARGKIFIDFIEPTQFIKLVIVTSPFLNQTEVWQLRWGTYGQTFVILCIWLLWIVSLFKLKKFYYQTEGSFKKTETLNPR